MDNTKELRVISFCAGYGGIERGLELAGVRHRVVAYVEIEAFAIANLVSKMESGELAPAPIYTDLKTFPAKHFRGKVDIFLGGYPCQPFSVAGKGLGKEDPRHLWPYLLEHIRAINPVRCFWENVTGHINRGLEEVIEDMEGEGFRTTWGIFSAAEVGAKHRRERIFILADSEHRRCDALQAGGGLASSEVLVCESSTGGTRGNEWPPEPAVGRVAHGTPDRVDRLRMLGNGVVPQTACRAWQVLSRRFIDAEQNDDN